MDLRTGKTHALVGMHRFDHVVDQRTELSGLDVLDLEV